MPSSPVELVMTFIGVLQGPIYIRLTFGKYRVFDFNIAASDRLGL